MLQTIININALHYTIRSPPTTYIANYIKHFQTIIQIVFDTNKLYHKIGSYLFDSGATRFNVAVGSGGTSQNDLRLHELMIGMN
jgi:hypothetical protein